MRTRSDKINDAKQRACGPVPLWEFPYLIRINNYHIHSLIESARRHFRRRSGPAHRERLAFILQAPHGFVGPTCCSSSAAKRGGPSGFRTAHAGQIGFARYTQSDCTSATAETGPLIVARAASTFVLVGASEHTGSVALASPASKNA
jgi:hypothetical protein